MTAWLKGLPTCEDAPQQCWQLTGEELLLLGTCSTCSSTRNDMMSTDNKDHCWMLAGFKLGQSKDPPVCMLSTWDVGPGLRTILHAILLEPSVHPHLKAGSCPAAPPHLLLSR